MTKEERIDARLADYECGKCPKYTKCIAVAYSSPQRRACDEGFRLISERDRLKRRDGSG